MKEIRLKYSEDLAFAVQTTPEELEAQVLLMAALKMFEFSL